MNYTFTLLCLATLTATMIACRETNSSAVPQLGRTAESKHVTKNYLKSMTSAEKRSALRRFWSQFQEAARAGDCKWVVTMWDCREERYGNRQDRLEFLEFAFQETVRDAIVNTPFDQLKRTADNHCEYWAFRFNNGVESEGQFCAEYQLQFVGSRVRIVSIVAAG